MEKSAITMHLMSLSPHVIVNIVKAFILKAFTESAVTLPFGLVHAMDGPEDKSYTFNKLVTNSLNENFLLKRTKITKPAAPCLKELNINSLKQQRNKARKKACSTLVERNWKTFGNIKNNIEKEIKKAKFEFYCRALSSKRPKEVWNVIHKVLQPNS